VFGWEKNQHFGWEDQPIQLGKSAFGWEDQHSVMKISVQLGKESAFSWEDQHSVMKNSPFSWENNQRSDGKISVQLGK
jgi:hypothetical protein